MLYIYNNYNKYCNKKTGLLDRVCNIILTIFRHVCNKILLRTVPFLILSLLDTERF